MRSDYFIDFIHYDAALKSQEKYKFLIEKYNQNIEAVKNCKLDKVREIDSLLGVIDLLEGELKEFKKLMPLPSSEDNVPVKESSAPKRVVKKSVKKSSVKKAIVRPKLEIKHSKDLNSLKMGLERIRDELSNL